MIKIAITLNKSSITIKMAVISLFNMVFASLLERPCNLVAPPCFNFTSKYEISRPVAGWAQVYVPPFIPGSQGGGTNFMRHKKRKQKIKIAIESNFVTNIFSKVLFVIQIKKQLSAFRTKLFGILFLSYHFIIGFR